MLVEGHETRYSAYFKFNNNSSSKTMANTDGERGWPIDNTMKKQQYWYICTSIRHCIVREVRSGDVNA